MEIIWIVVACYEGQGNKCGVQLYLRGRLRGVCVSLRRNG